MVLNAQFQTCDLRFHEKIKNISPTRSTSKSQVQSCGVSFEKIKIFVLWSERHRSGPVSFTVMKEKKNILPTPSTSKSQVRTCGVSFGKIEIFVFMVLNAQVRTYKLRIHKKRKKDLPNPLDIKVTSPDLWSQFRKNQNLCFYNPKGTISDL